MPQSGRWQGQAPRDSLLHPVWDPISRGEPPDEEFVARCLLGAGWVAGRRRLSMLDLRVWAALCAMLREQLPDLDPDAPELRDMAVRTVETTGYQLAERVWGDVDGDKRRSLRRSLARLSGATVTVCSVEADTELAAETLIEGWVPLVGSIWLATTRLELTTPRQWGALKATTSLRVEIGHWPAQQVLAGRCTWLDLDLLRALGVGLPSRVWALLEAWARWPQRSLDGREETAIGLGRPALESLGVGGYRSRSRDARRALDRAGGRIVAVDPAYEFVGCVRRGGGWCLVVRRVSGSRARTQARQAAPWHSPGIAAAKRQRAERTKVRAAIRAGLG